MGFADLPKGYDDKKETAKQLAVLEFVHYAFLDENRNPAGKFYMTKDGHVLNKKEVEHLEKTGTFRRMKKWDFLRQPEYAYKGGRK
ncbi:MAG TPA: hypothetical protein O0X39_07665 [Methanocorpusculum sp.]|nr:hypothetical protein [Methanocorpusculum sp.]